MATFPVSDYPGAIDSDIPVAVDGEVIPATYGNGLRNAILATQTELGANPSGSEADVAARFTALDATIAGLPGADARVFDAVAYGAVVNGSTDDTAAWQAAITACAAAGGGVVTSSLNGVSVIGGALQDAAGANAQLLLPSIHVTSGEQVSIVLTGLVPAPTDISVIGSVVLPESHLVLKSTLASGTGAVIGAKGPSGSPGDFTNVHLRVENLTVRTVSNPTLSGLDLRRVAMVDVDGVVVDCGSYNVSGLTEPTSTGSYGIRLPQNNNGAHTVLGRVDVIGFYTGLEVAEHAVGTDVAAWGCKVAASFVAANHASTFTRLMVIHCERGLKFTGAHAVDVWQLDIEHAASGWMVTDYDLDDVSNFGKGFLRWHAVLAGVGDHDSFTVNGGSGFTTSRVGAALGSGGGGSASYVYRDRLVASVPNTGLTLGTTPVANSPLVWVNGAIKWPVTDYTISGATITFGSALTVSDVVTVQYHSAAASASASALTGGGVSITDDFARTDSAVSLGTTATGSKAWTALLGTWGIASNKGYLAMGPAGGIGLATVDSGVADCTIAAVLTSTAGNPNCGLAFRSTDTNNQYAVEVALDVSQAPTIWKRVGGTLTVIATGSAVTVASGDTLSVVLSGSSIIVKRNGTTIVSVTDSTFTTQTGHGLYEYRPSLAGVVRFDDFSITA